MPPKTLWIRIGDFFFKYRNKVFPLTLVILFLGFKPAHTYAGSHQWVIIKDWIAIMITLSGLLLRAAVIGFAYIKRGGMNKKVYADNLVTEGFFGICRNPLYVGNMLIYAGVFLMHGNPYVIVIGTLGYFLIYQSIIAAEEYFLRSKFGKAYDAYCHDVPRWRLQLSRWNETTEGMRFNLKRVIIKDYPTIGNAVIALVLIKLLEIWYFGTHAEFVHALFTHGALIAGVAIITVLISLAKKRKLLTL